MKPALVIFGTVALVWACTARPPTPGQHITGQPAGRAAMASSGSAVTGPDNAVPQEGTRASTNANTPGQAGDPESAADTV